MIEVENLTKRYGSTTAVDGLDPDGVKWIRRLLKDLAGEGAPSSSPRT